MWLKPLQLRASGEHKWTSKPFEDSLLEGILNIAEINLWAKLFKGLNRIRRLQKFPGVLSFYILVGNSDSTGGGEGRD